MAKLAAPKKPTAKAAPKKPSSRSKTGNSECSAAASNWQLSIRGKAALNPDTYQTLAKCRALSSTKKKADAYGRTGKLSDQGAAALKGRLQSRFDSGLITQKSRNERLNMLLKQRKETQSIEDGYKRRGMLETRYASDGTAFRTDPKVVRQKRSDEARVLRSERGKAETAVVAKPVMTAENKGTYGDYYFTPEGKYVSMSGSGGMGSNRVGARDINGKMIGWYDRKELRFANEKQRPTKESESASERLSEISKEVSDLREKNARLLIGRDTTDKLRRELSQGNITKEKYDELVKKGYALSDKDYALSGEVQKQIESVKSRLVQLATPPPASVPKAAPAAPSPTPPRYSLGGKLAPGRGTEERMKAAGILKNLRSRNNDGRTIAMSIHDNAVNEWGRWGTGKTSVGNDPAFRAKRILNQSEQMRVSYESSYADSVIAADKLVTKTGKLSVPGIRGDTNTSFYSTIMTPEMAVKKRLESLRASASTALNYIRIMKQAGIPETGFIAKPKATKDYRKNPLTRLRAAVKLSR